jgi:hypothetical protein
LKFLAVMAFAFEGKRTGVIERSVFVEGSWAKPWISWVLHDSKAAKSEELLEGCCACGCCCGSRGAVIGGPVAVLESAMAVAGVGGAAIGTVMRMIPGFDTVSSASGSDASRTHQVSPYREWRCENR